MDGLVEWFNHILIWKLVKGTCTDWENFQSYLLFAYRKVPQDSTGFSPFELL